MSKILKNYFKNLKLKLDNYIDEKMVVVELYDKWMKLPFHELYTESTYYTIKNSIGEGYAKEVHTLHKVLKDRNTTPEEVIDAHVAWLVAQELGGYENVSRNNR